MSEEYTSACCWSCKDVMDAVSMFVVEEAVFELAYFAMLRSWVERDVLDEVERRREAEVRVPVRRGRVMKEEGLGGV